MLYIVCCILYFIFADLPAAGDMIDWTPEIWSGKKFQPIRTKFLKKEESIKGDQGDRPLGAANVATVQKCT